MKAKGPERRRKREERRTQLRCVLAPTPQEEWGHRVLQTGWRKAKHSQAPWARPDTSGSPQSTDRGVSGKQVTDPVQGLCPKENADAGGVSHSPSPPALRAHRLGAACHPPGHSGTGLASPQPPCQLRSPAVSLGAAGETLSFILTVLQKATGLPRSPALCCYELDGAGRHGCHPP